MSGNSKRYNGDNILEKMSIEELESIIKMDTPFMNDESDSEYILKVLEVIEKREKEKLSSKYNTNIDEAWESFNKNYKEDESDNIVVLPAENFYCKESYKTKKFVRVASILVALLILICSVSIATSIFNYNIWGAMASWGENTFGFVTMGSGLKNETELHNKLAEYNVFNAKIPKKIPKDYECIGVEVIETPRKTIFSANYLKDDKEITISVNLLNDITSLTYEKNDEVEIYNKNDIAYYIMNNYEQIQAIWLFENCEYIIKGDISKTELKKIIDSV